jgi:hypothetical protein
MCDVGSNLAHWIQRQWGSVTAIMSRFAMVLVVAAYILVMLGAAFFVLPATHQQGQISATRFLGANTRVAKGLWAEPADPTWTQRIALDRLEEELSGKYIKQPVEAANPIAPENVASWPNMPDEDIVPVPLEAEPDWMTLNEGSMVEVWVGDKLATRQPALVEAIVGSGAQWTALLRRSDFAADALKDWADKPKLRLVRLPRKPQWSPT